MSVPGVGHVRMKMHEGDADPILQLISCKDIQSIGWVKFVGEEIPNESKVTLCHKEYEVKWKGLFKVDRNTL